MQIKLTLRSDEPITIPVNYNYYIQSMIYSMLSIDTGYSKYLHDSGLGDFNKFKLFTFGKLSGKYSFIDNNLIFKKQISFEIRSVSENFCEVFKNALIFSKSIDLCGNKLSVDDYFLSDTVIESFCLKITTNSPLVSYSFDEGSTIFYTPEQQEFYDNIKLNFKNKFEAFYSKKPDEAIILAPDGIYKKIVTKYKNIWLNAYTGSFTLQGNPETLSFAYNTGLGRRSSQGFGMFDIV